MNDEALDRRGWMNSVMALGVGGDVFARALAAKLAPENRRVTADDIKAAEWVAGISLTDPERADLARRLNRERAGVRAARRVDIPTGTPPAVRFDPSVFSDAEASSGVKNPFAPVKAASKLDGPDLDFADLADLAGQLAAGHWTSLALTERVLARLGKGDETLKCVVTLTPELARRQARAADARRAAGRVLGPLDGVPWGAKDLVSHPAAPTTWGAGHYEKQQLNETATVARKLEAAGCVMVAKLTLGALALGDKWFGGMTRNPWNPKEGSSGSSAGSAAAVAAGLVPFAIGSETLGSIVSPSTRCGATGLRPTYGRVSRAGCMTLGVVDGQARADLPLRDRLRPGAGRDPRRGPGRPGERGPAVPLALPAPGRGAARRLHPDRHAGGEAGGTGGA